MRYDEGTKGGVGKAHADDCGAPAKDHPASRPGETRSHLRSRPERDCLEARALDIGRFGRCGERLEPSPFAVRLVPRLTCLVRYFEGRPPRLVWTNDQEGEHPIYRVPGRAPSSLAEGRT